MKKLFKTKSLRKLPFYLLAMAIMVGGIFIYKVSATSPLSIATATGAENVSIDTTSHAGGSGTWTAISGPVIHEGAAGDIALGDHTLTLPSGWEFNTAQSATLSITGGSALTLANSNILPASDHITFTVTATSTGTPAVLAIANLEVRPTGSNPVGTGYMTQTVGTMSNVNNGVTSFGTFTTVPGVVTKLAFSTQPSATTIYGSNFSQQPVVVTQDQFGNNSTNGLAAGENVSLALTTGSTGTLQGTASISIGSGTASFSGLSVGLNGAVQTGKTLTATASGSNSLTSAQSSSFDITAKSVTVTAVSDTKTYDGYNTSSANPSVGSLVFNDVVNVSPTQTFNNKNQGSGKTLTPAGLTIKDSGSSANTTGNYSITYTPVSTGVINKKN